MDWLTIVGAHNHTDAQGKKTIQLVCQAISDHSGKNTKIPELQVYQVQVQS